MGPRGQGLCLVVAFCLATVTVNANVQLTEDHGVFGPEVTPDGKFSSEHLIRVRPGRKVSIRFTALDLDSDDGDTVTIRDGRRSRIYHVYTRAEDGRINKRIDDLSGAGHERPDAAVSEPVQFDASTKRVFVTYYTSNFRRKTGYRAEYETYPEEACLISALQVRDRAPRCDGYRIAPVATRCSHTIRCSENYKQRGDAVCTESSWVDNTQCLPQRRLVDQCEFDENGITNDCPFDLQELTNFYLLTDNTGVVSVDAEEGFGRSLGTRMRARCSDDICIRTANCKRRFGRRGRRRKFRLCRICKLVVCGKRIYVGV